MSDPLSDEGLARLDRLIARIEQVTIVLERDYTRQEETDRLTARVVRLEERRWARRTPRSAP